MSATERTLTLERAEHVRLWVATSRYLRDVERSDQRQTCGRGTDPSQTPSLTRLPPHNIRHARLSSICPLTCLTLPTPKSPLTTVYVPSPSAAKGSLELTQTRGPPPSQELDVLKRQYEKELASSHTTVQTKFNYAWGLVKSQNKSLQMEGVKLLQGASLVRRLQTASKSPVLTSPILPHPLPEIYAAEPLRRRECLYYLALGYYKLGNWEHAKKFNSTSQPSSSFARALSAELVLSFGDAARRPPPQQGTDQHASPVAQQPHRRRHGKRSAYLSLLLLKCRVSSQEMQR
jgi:hypothetical protein